MPELANELLTVSIAERGAELSSVIRKSDQTQYMWQADPAYWKRHAPVLFPIVGRLKDNQYTYHEKVYQMSQHGLARDLPFEVISHTTDRLSFRLQEQELTREKYPFAFTFDMHYVLDGNALEVIYEVHNPNEDILPFSIGAHPAFSCPIVPEESLTDYEVRFEQAETADRQLLNEGLFDGRTAPFLTNSDRFDITEHVFDEDALVFLELTSSYVELRSKVSDRRVRVTLDDWPYLGVWAKPGAPFVCLEPWQGLADQTSASGDLTEKAGMILLLPGQTHRCSYEVIFD